MMPKEWLKTFREMLDNQKVQPVVLEPQDSVFGQVYVVLTPNKEEAMPLWEESGKLHLELHKKAKELYNAISSGNWAIGESIYGEMEDISDKIAAKIEEVVSIQVKTDFSKLY